MQLNIFTSIMVFLESVSNMNLRDQIDQLLAVSFPDEFNNVSLIDQMQSLIEQNTIKDGSIITFMALYDRSLYDRSLCGFAQIMQDGDKLRLINFCRDKSLGNRGLGKGIIDEMRTYLRTHNNENTKNIHLYLTVRMDNESLKKYYESIGWTFTGRADMRGQHPGMEYSIAI